MTQDRDRTLEQALTHELRANDAAPRSPLDLRSNGEDGCLDAETLAAWEDGGLDAAIVARAEAHVSSCARCQAMVAASLRGTPAIGPADAEAPGRSLWRWWLAPLAASAAAVTLWMVVPEQRESAIAPGRPSAPVAADTQAPQTPPPQAAAPRAEAAESLPASARTDRQTLKDAAAGNVAAADTAAPSMKEEARRMEAPRPPAMLAEPITVAPPSAAAESVAGTAAAPAPPVGALQRSARFAGAVLEVTAPGGAHRWRVAPAGIERSEDGGTTWAVVRELAGESITGGVAPSPSVCWLIGQAGVVLLAVDGTTFTRVDVPDKSAIASIAAVNGQSATVTMSTGRTFRTDDGGRTWR